LEIHHKTYERFGRELASDLEILCPRCHEAANRERRAQLQHEFEQRCATTAYENARETYFKKRFGEGYEPSEFEYREFDEWIERKRWEEPPAGGCVQ
jgi:hypothetical protein